MAATLSPAMLAPSSPEHDDPSDWLAEGERWAGEMPLRRGIHAQAQTKLCMLQLHFMFTTGQLKLVMGDQQKVPKGNVAKVALALDCAVSSVQDAICEAERTGRVSDPDLRGRDPTRPEDYCNPEAFVLVRRALRDLEKETIPNSAPKIVERVDGYAEKDSDGCLIKLSKDQVNNMLAKAGYVFGAAGHHHVDKENPGNVLYRARYVKIKRENRDENGFPINPELYMDESFAVRTHKRVMHESFVCKLSANLSLITVCVTTCALSALSLCCRTCTICAAASGTRSARPSRAAAE